jgi:hypothetical protein
MKRLLAAIAVVFGLAAMVLPGTPTKSSAEVAVTPTIAVAPTIAKPLAAPATAVPLLAYYYLWFDPSSWTRAKKDYPQLGRYSSDDTTVMRKQIELAKSAGIGGFIVSWKHTEINDRRLRLLMGVAKDMDFKLAMIYQGLDFDRNPLPADQVAADFAMFRTQFASDPVFVRLGGKPLTIWSGTWEFSHDDVARVTGAVRADMLVLSTEKSVDGYRRIADVTDGDAYYWSSINPESNRAFGVKLDDMAASIHADGKYWIAPFAPGFDARMVGGSKEVPRNDGATLRSQYGAAVRSSPDVLGLISWNEFSENSYVEPSEKYGRRYLDVLTELRGAAAPDAPLAVDSSDSGAPDQPVAATTATFGRRPNLALLAGFPLVLALGVGLAALLRRRSPAPSHNLDA